MIRTIYVKNFKCYEELFVECRSLNLLYNYSGVASFTSDK
ncbi:hypothetical protein C823_002031 [Eubacterium plexicaudatum ASF492]|uniref:Uncharacterized protein n=1 Tax=Eubacterium plexicaudatum ASF492 TaxID=1235802 RepID=N2B7G1_9FIRM|nr:hypothetical protein C823_002031 [Eubacterium plexicaudatum ASF492]